MKQHSISDDDLCSGCANLEYDPGNLSTCTKQDSSGNWPCHWNVDGYAISCPKFKQCAPGANVVARAEEAEDANQS